MGPVNIEIKARCADHAPLRAILEAHRARYIGQDHQVDTYFKVPDGRLKLRQGNIENSLIHYRRPDQDGPKQSDILITPVDPFHAESLKAILTASAGVQVVVDKRRHIFFIDNVKFHLDKVDGLGTFVEIEAIDRRGKVGVEKLREQCEHFMQLLNIKEEDLVARSYSDMIGEGASSEG